MEAGTAPSLGPSKRINSGDDLAFFLTSKAYKDLKIWLLQLNRAAFPTGKANGPISACTLNDPPALSGNVQSLRSLVGAFSDLVARAPPHTGPRRFGNVAFRDWHRLAEDEMNDILDRELGQALKQHGSDSSARAELRTYLLGSFGSAQRLDYGTGHELSFIAFLGCLSKMGLFEVGEERAIVVGVIHPYLEMIRKLVSTYTLEPAGSHGVWGLDDHFFIPYIFGSAQLGPPIESPDAPTPVQGSLDTAPGPETITSKPTVAEQKPRNLYFAAIDFIYEVKKGPFWEHSPILYNISGIEDGWGKINKGMIKMYDAEVLGKFPVVQHFPFGKFFPWEADPEAQAAQASIHALNQPNTSQGPSMAPPGTGVGTAAPWAKPGATAGGTPSARGYAPPTARSRP